MDGDNLIRFFEGKNILITGATGFLAKILVEKILRIQPNVKKLILLIRATDAKSATQRFHDEVASTELFRLLREKWGEEFTCFLSAKVHPVRGDISLPIIGIEDCKLTNEICSDIDLIVNAAGVTRFDERTIDSLIVAYGKGKLKRFIGNQEAILDFIPGDLVVNSIIVAMMQKAITNQSSEIIYHIGSSSRNPIKLHKVSDLIFQNFTKNPYTIEKGNLVIVSEPEYFRNMAHFRFNVGAYYFFAKCSLTRKIKYIMRLGELYRPYVFFNGVFDDHNTERLQNKVREWHLDEDLLCFDPTTVNWEDYFMTVHFPGVVRYLMK